MTTSPTIEKEYEHIGETSGCKNHDHDLIHELSKRLDGVWRYDQYIANAEGQENLQKFWQSVKAQEQDNICEIKKLISQQIEAKCF
ncbi:hypothetical protein [Gimesia sp.]|uniref:hypothetical protein n=1 Tax=Gimesia sp. TaxID=2024833 RepID=UPI003A942636